MNKTTNQRIKINICTSGRFHIFYLARELYNLGYDVRFYSYIPQNRAMRYGMPKTIHTSLFFWLAPFIFIERNTSNKWLKGLRAKVQDILTSIAMRKCDICIVMSGLFNRTIKREKKKGTTIIVHRGSKHILEQKRILDSIIPTGKVTTVLENNVKTELISYDAADYISVCSKHCRESFLKYGCDEKKIFTDCQGVDLSMFGVLPNFGKKYDLIMVGGWSYRKGCDLIIDAIKRTKLSLLHVGSIVDLAFPNEPNFKHVDPVDQVQLIKYYNQAKVFLMPSREEGFGMVYTQALACNLPIIGSPDSGAVDLKAMVKNPEFITIIKDYTTDAVCDAIYESMANYTNLGDGLYAGDAIQNLTWKAYGNRYAKFINTIIKEK